MNYLQLKTELENEIYDGLSAADCVELLNEQNITQSVDVPRLTALNHLAKSAVWDKLELAKLDANLPSQLRARISTFCVTLQNIDPLDFVNFEADIPTLVSAGVISQTEADDFMVLSQISVSKAEAEFGRLVTENDINRARWSDQVDAFKVLRDSKAQELATLNAQIADLESGNAYHELEEVE
jgi:hypothetical protein